ncbi:hypothetical protein [Guptibacillus algicola]|nr:hypothetical protein [Alkalihalobacillus algicola]
MSTKKNVLHVLPFPILLSLVEEKFDGRIRYMDYLVIEDAPS